ncbi:hypothetical protein [Dyadobacter frigoris]|uniref:ATP-grasp domain-containing protein n=1 Tax=Dyadobacter frigoris TaxID=2576211 RepID=A0A4U6CWX1_9BACT|nr:hypothetical protein [Dyadobacter frigoris]TKT88157.1 hypothetical protein FDK13_27680 [Dyadobacter frigoris]GLU53773.1 hypothetical protein Dfri01_32340 [Dyadobacter frigoris]
MTSKKYSILYLTDLYFEAKGRKYCEEDLYLTSRLREHFDILLCHPCDSEKFEEIVDLIIFRNTGPVMHYKNYFNSFITRINTKKSPTYNAMSGKADMKGKSYLAKLTKEGYPVIPTIEHLQDLPLLPESDKYMIKLKDGADSIGMQVVDREGLVVIELGGNIIQPFVDFVYEVSFYFIDNDFQYALYAPDKSKRWELEIYDATANDLTFADRFITWNTVTHGIQRVDACRTSSGDLLLVELEDLNPYLSLDLLSIETREKFVVNFIESINKTIAENVSGL